jgi:hypothetical protein
MDTAYVLDNILFLRREGRGMGVGRVRKGGFLN